MPRAALFAKPVDEAAEGGVAEARAALVVGRARVEHAFDGVENAQQRVDYGTADVVALAVTAATAVAVAAIAAAAAAAASATATTTTVDASARRLSSIVMKPYGEILEGSFSDFSSSFIVIIIVSVAIGGDMRRRRSDIGLFLDNFLGSRCRRRCRR